MSTKEKEPLTVVQEPSTRAPKLPPAEEQRKQAEAKKAQITKRISKWSESAPKFQHIGSPIKDIKLYALQLNRGCLLLSKDANGGHSLVVLPDSLRVDSRSEISEDGATETLYYGIVSKA